MKACLTRKEVERICLLREQGVYPKKIALMFGRSQGTILDCLKNPERYLSREELPEDYYEVLKIAKEEIEKIPRGVLIYAGRIKVKPQALSIYLKGINKPPAKVIEYMRTDFRITPEQIKERKTLLGRL